MLFTNSFSSSSDDFTTSRNHASTITVEALSKKWSLDKYKYSIFSEAPSEKEKGDFLHFKTDMNFESVAEGIQDAGQWRLDVSKKRIYLFKEKEKGELVFIIERLSKNKLVLTIDDPSDKEAKQLKIYYKAI